MKNQCLIQFEWRKLLSKSTLLLLLVFLIIKVVFLWFTTLPDTDDQLYKGLIGQIQGELSEEKGDWLEQEKQHRDAVMSGYPQMKADYIKGEISYEQFHPYDLEFESISKEKIAFERLYQKYRYFLQKGEEHQELIQMSEKGDVYLQRSSQISLEQFIKPMLFFYDTGWGKAIGEGTMDYFLLIFLMMVCIPYFLKEHECGMVDIVGVSAKRNVLYAYKTLHILLFGFLCAVLSQGIELIFYMARYEFPCSQASLQSIEAFAAYPHSLSVFSAAVCSIFLRLCGIISLLFFTCAVCMLTKKIVASLLVYIVVVFFPAIGQYSLSSGVTAYLFPHILSGSQVFASYEFYNWLGYPVPNIWIMMAFYVILLAASVFVIWKRCNCLKS